MCKSFDKREISICGIFWSSFFGFIGISSLVLSIIQFPYTRLHWMNKGGWRHLGGLGISGVAVQFCFCVFSILTFSIFSNKKLLLFIYSIIQLVGSIFVLFISIFTLVGAQHYKNEDTNLCNKTLSNFFSSFFVLDDYFHIVDQYLCSKDCQCVFTNISAYQEFSIKKVAIPEPEIITEQWKYMEKYSIYKKKGDKKRASSFLDCSEEIQSLAKSYFIDELIAKNNTNIFEIDNFYNYWKRIEEKFKCTGWCNNKYTDRDNNTRIVAKYLFSSIDGGIVKNRGCMKSVIRWLPKIMNAFGSTLLCTGFFMLIPLFFSISLLLRIYKNYDEDYNDDDQDDQDDKLKEDNYE